MKIGLDIMGGDFAPEAAVLGAIEAQKQLAHNQKLVLFGNKDQALSILLQNQTDPDIFDFVHTTEVIGMGEHPTKAITQKLNSSINVGFDYLKDGKIDSFASAGNTGAMLVGSMFSVKTVAGVTRPAIPTNVPKLAGGFGVMLDVGANADCKPEVLFQFGILGKLYAEYICKIKQPRVALINIGEEEEKGNILSQAAFALMKDTSAFNFVGNIEGRDLFNEKADVIVCDGFTGNIMLKLAESFYTLAVKKGFTDDFLQGLNYEKYGGSPVLGVNAPVIIGHGISNPEAIKNMVLLSKKMIETNLVDKIKEAFKQ